MLEESCYWRPRANFEPRHELILTISPSSEGYAELRSQTFWAILIGSRLRNSINMLVYLIVRGVDEDIRVSIRSKVEDVGLSYYSIFLIQ